MTAPPPPAPRRRRSIVVPVYRNEDGIDDLVTALAALARSLDGPAEDVEVVFVIDGSPDASYERLVRRLPEAPFRSQVILHTRNFGAFAAIRTGLAHARGDDLAVLAADLQEPPELLERFFAELATGAADIVVGQRVRRGDGWLTRTTSALFWALYRRFVQPEMPKGGVDVFGCTREACDALLSIEEHGGSLVAQLFWIGFRRKCLPYERRKRRHGRSAWSFSRRLNYMLDSVFSYSDLPILLLLYCGLGFVLLSFGLAGMIFLAWAFGYITQPGYTPIMLSLLLVASLIITTQGVIGCYVWRVLENSKKRPLSLTYAKKIIYPGAPGPAAATGERHE